MSVSGYSGVLHPFLVLLHWTFFTFVLNFLKPSFPRTRTAALPKLHVHVHDPWSVLHTFTPKVIRELLPLLHQLSSLLALTVFRALSPNRIFSYPMVQAVEVIIKTVMVLSPATVPFSHRCGRKMWTCWRSGNVDCSTSLCVLGLSPFLMPNVFIFKMKKAKYKIQH